MLARFLYDSLKGSKKLYSKYVKVMKHLFIWLGIFPLPLGYIYTQLGETEVKENVLNNLKVVSFWTLEKLDFKGPK